MNDSPPRLHRRYTSTSNINEHLLTLRGGSKKLSESDVLNGGVQECSFTYEPRSNEIIESYGRESQQAIAQLNESVRKYKSEIEKL